MKEIEPDEILDIASRAGTLILENGGETYRAEETMVYIARSMGARNASAFVTPTVIILSYRDNQNHHYSTMQRIRSRGVNLKKVSLVNALSRRLTRRGRTSNPLQVERLIDRIEQTPTYPAWFIVVASAISSVFFALMFGGSWRECIAAFVIGVLLRVFLMVIEKLEINSFITSVLSGGLIALLSELALRVHLVSASAPVITAVLMLVVPGLAIVNAIRDIIAGDLVSGGARVIDAFMIAAGLSVGAAFGVVLLPSGGAF